MAFISKKRKVAATKVDGNKSYSLKEASALVKLITTCKFDASVDLHVRLGVDPKKADQAIRGTVTLPHGTGKTKKVLVLCPPDKEAEAKAAGADYLVPDLLAPGLTLVFCGTAPSNASAAASARTPAGRSRSGSTAS